MKKITIIITILSCIFIIGCNRSGEKIESLEEAYFYLIDKTENKENMRIEDVKNLLKDYELKVSDLSEIHDVKGEKSYEYIFTRDNESDASLHVGFIVSNKKETIDFLQYSRDDDSTNLMTSISDNKSDFSIHYSNLDKSFYEKILNKTDELGLSLPENDPLLEETSYYIVNEGDKGKNVEIDEIKNLLKDYNLEVELKNDGPSEDCKEYSYRFTNSNIERLVISAREQYYSEEGITSISHFIGNYPRYLSFYFGSPIQGEETTVHVSYDTDNKNLYKKLYNIINESN